MDLAACESDECVKALAADRNTEETLKRTLNALATLTQGIAELRGQLGTGHGDDPAAPHPPADDAGLAVRMATAVGVSLYERHRGDGPDVGGPAPVRGRL